MQDRYITHFEQLTPTDILHLANRIHQRHPIFIPEAGGNYESGADLYHHCDSCGLDHADVVMSLAPDPSPEAVRILETLVGISPIRRTPASRPSGTPRDTSRQKPKIRDDRRVLAVVPNPKRPGSASHARYELWKVGMTITEARVAGLTSGDVQHDISKGFITLED